MNPSTPSSGSRQLSSSLKERLKRCGRYHNSPVSMSSASSLAPPSLLSPATTDTPDQATPNRKRLSSSPLRCKVPNKRQILQCSQLEEDECHTEIPANPTQQVDKEAADETIEGQDSFDQTCNKSDHLNDVHHELQGHDLNLTEDGSVILNKTEQETKLVLNDKDGNKVEKEENISVYDAKENRPESSTVCDSNVVIGVKRARLDQAAISEGENAGLDQGMTRECGVGDEEETRRQLLKELQQRRETLRQLKMVQMYRTKNNLEELQGLIDKWRGVVQLALPDLHTEMSVTTETRPSLTQLVDHLGIPHDLVEYDQEEETFGT